MSARFVGTAPIQGDHCGYGKGGLHNLIARHVLIGGENSKDLLSPGVRPMVPLVMAHRRAIGGGAADDGRRRQCSPWSPTSSRLQPPMSWLGRKAPLPTSLPVLPAFLA